MGPPLGSISQYHHSSSSSMPNEAYQMMNGYDFLNSSGHHQSSFSSTSLGTFQHSPFSNQGQSFNSNTMHFNQNQGMIFNYFLKISYYFNFFSLIAIDYTSKHLNETTESIISKPAISPTSSGIPSESPYSKHHIETSNGWPANNYQSQQYSLSSLCQPTTAATNVPLDYHQPYSSSSKYWS